jgi:hypothetical protein
MKKESNRLSKEDFLKMKNMRTSMVRIMKIFMIKIINSTTKEIKEIINKDNKMWKIWVNFMKERIQLSTHKMSNLFKMSQEASSLQ